MGALIAAVLSFFVIAADPSFGAEARYNENKVGEYLIRVSQGAAEPASTGSYSIHVYKNNGDQFIVGLIQSRDGSVVKVWAMKADEGNGLSIFVSTRSAGSGSHGNLDEFKFHKLLIRAVRIPDPPKALLKGYMGRDDFDIRNGAVYRSFPIYLAKDANCCPTGGTITLRLDRVARKWKIAMEK